MSVLEISARDRDEVQAYLLRVKRATPEWKKATAKKIREMQAGKAVSIAELEARFARGRASGVSPLFLRCGGRLFAALPRRQQRKVLDRAHELAADPFLVPDDQSQDADQRMVSPLLTEGFIFDYWVDHAVRKVMITDIEKAG